MAGTVDAVPRSLRAISREGKQVFDDLASSCGGCRAAVGVGVGGWAAIGGGGPEAERSALSLRRRKQFAMIQQSRSIWRSGSSTSIWAQGGLGRGGSRTPAGSPRSRADHVTTTGSHRHRCALGGGSWEVTTHSPGHVSAPRGGPSGSGCARPTPASCAICRAADKPHADNVRHRYLVRATPRFAGHLLPLQTISLPGDRRHRRPSPVRGRSCWAAAGGRRRSRAAQNAVVTLRRGLGDLRSSRESRPARRGLPGDCSAAAPRVPSRRSCRG
jgi:hypothetical protein